MAWDVLELHRAAAASYVVLHAQRVTKMTGKLSALLGQLLHNANNLV